MYCLTAPTPRVRVLKKLCFVLTRISRLLRMPKTLVIYQSKNPQNRAFCRLPWRRRRPRPRVTMTGSTVLFFFFFFFLSIRQANLIRQLQLHTAQHSKALHFSGTQCWPAVFCLPVSLGVIWSALAYREGEKEAMQLDKCVFSFSTFQCLAWFALLLRLLPLNCLIATQNDCECSRGWWWWWWWWWWWREGWEGWWYIGFDWWHRRRRPRRWLTDCLSDCSVLSVSQSTTETSNCPQHRKDFFCFVLPSTIFVFVVVIVGVVVSNSDSKTALNQHKLTVWGQKE